MKTLREHLPQRASIEGTIAEKFLGNFVTKVVDDQPWPGKEKNVHRYWVLESGHLVGWNENPGRGWSFPVISNPKDKAKADRDKKITEKLRAVIESDPIADIALDAINQGVTPAEFTAIIKMIKMLPDPIRLQIENTYSDVATSIKYGDEGHRRKGMFSTGHFRE